ncbi:MAG: phosphodiester glycosidase family protein [Kiritimatiellae bacterium]|nr:phosphodiester glycosidase family protein [Kiritimatiellia bacterium]
MKHLAAFLAVVPAIASLLPAAQPPSGSILPAPLQAKALKACSQRTLAPGVTYVSAHFSNLLGDGPVATYWLVIDWKKCAKGTSLNIARNPVRRERPTDLAKATHALACVNGTYHSTTDPSTPHFQLKVRGELIPSKPGGGDATLAFNRGEMPFVGRFSTDLLDKYENVISGDGVPGRGQPLPDYSDQSAAARKKRGAARAPRTFAGNDVTNRITVIGVADGRQPWHSIGVNYVELRYLLECWGCDPGALVSLDGGGSSVMACRKGAKLEIQNIPSDGAPVIPTERRVAESIQIIDATSRPDAKIKK